MQHLWKSLTGAGTIAAAVVSFALMTTPASAEEVSVPVATNTPVATDTPVATETPVATGTPVATDTTEPEPGEAGWHYTEKGAIRYYDETGTPYTGYQEIDGIPYLFSSDGVLKTGWQTVNGKRYYYDPATGTPQFGWFSWHGGRYYIQKDSGKAVGWITLEENGTASRYYFDTDGVLQTGFFRTDASGGLYYADETGAAMVGGVHEIDGIPYWFYDDGIIHTGWQTINGQRLYFHPITGKAEYGWVIWHDQYYYVSPETGKYTGLQQIDGEYYPFSETSGAVDSGFCTLPDETVRYYYHDGSYQKGWLSLKGVSYYFSEAGAMQTGWQSIGGNIYYLGTDGAMAVGFTEIEDETYYFDPSGAQQFGLQKIDRKWYYLDTDTGIMHYGWINLNNNTYYFQEDGSARTGWMDLSGKRYYFGADGLLNTGWQTIGGKRYCFRSDGSMVTGWQTAADGNRYYFNDDGVMATGWQNIGGNTYYFRDNGTDTRGIVSIGSYKYYFDPESGVLLRSQTKNGITTNADGAVTKVVLSTPYLSQSGFPTGCESASAVMLLRDAGYSISIGTFIDTALDIGYLYYEGGILYGPDPNKAFIGDPRSSHGYGCYAPVITNALNRVLTGGDVAKNITGTSMSRLLTDYIDNGTPVAIWATINMMVPDNGTQWIVPETGGLFTWKRHEHCLVLVGYDNNYYYMNDPYNSNGLKAYSRAVVDARYAAMGYQAVVIEQN
ncbi:C39 family peptidase [uncultured Ruminococcus sp.]|mgnify:CR=1 FL=1|uniref:C39 family peptidase n=1 Tax=uncultured Ruminococcus sp. TaxID=165186 RepID=UPI002615E90A|nr:C39 family peptidase [uncultured Ruminococcus sp.]